MLTHARADEDPDDDAAVSNAYRSTANPLTIRSREQVLAVFGDTALIEPGLVDATEWRPTDQSDGGHRAMWAGVGRLR